MKGLTDQAREPAQEAGRGLARAFAQSRVGAAAREVLHQPGALGAAEAWRVVSTLGQLAAEVRAACELAAGSPADASAASAPAESSTTSSSSGEESVEPPRWLVPANALATRLEEASAWWTGKPGFPWTSWDEAASEQLGMLLCELDALAAEVLSAAEGAETAEGAGAALPAIEDASSLPEAEKPAADPPSGEWWEQWNSGYIEPTPEFMAGEFQFTSPHHQSATPAADERPHCGFAAPSTDLAPACGDAAAGEAHFAPSLAAVATPDQPAPLGGCTAPSSAPGGTPLAPPLAAVAAPDQRSPSIAYTTTPSPEPEIDDVPIPAPPEPPFSFSEARSYRRPPAKLLPSIGFATAAVVGVIGGLTLATTHAASLRSGAIASVPVPFTLHDGKDGHTTNAAAAAHATPFVAPSPVAPIVVGTGNTGAVAAAGSRNAETATQQASAAARRVASVLAEVAEAAHGFKAAYIPRHAAPHPRPHRHQRPDPAYQAGPTAPEPTQLDTIVAAIRASAEQEASQRLRAFGTAPSPLPFMPSLP